MTWDELEIRKKQVAQAQASWLEINESKIKGWQSDVKTFVARRPPIAKLVDELPDTATVLELKHLR
jgi:hypothetical protein